MSIATFLILHTFSAASLCPSIGKIFTNINRMTLTSEDLQGSFSISCIYYNISRVMKKPAFAYVKTKVQISCEVTAQLIIAFVSAT